MRCSGSATISSGMRCSGSAFIVIFPPCSLRGSGDCSAPCACVRSLRRGTLRCARLHSTHSGDTTLHRPLHHSTHPHPKESLTAGKHTATAKKTAFRLRRALARLRFAHHRPRPPRHGIRRDPSLPPAVAFGLPPSAILFDILQKVCKKRSENSWKLPGTQECRNRLDSG